MSREDPQFRIRLPVELKEKIEEAAKENNRSLNAEIVFRLDSSFLDELPEDELISAKDALAIVSRAKDELSNIIFKRTFAVINEKIRIGHTSFHVSLTDLDLEGLSEEDFVSVFDLTFKRLESLGYEVWDSSWDVTGFMVEIPKK
ncbi:Arc family DNA-binding protein [Pantoea brenneri]|uniref:Arc family DNA-binding protein n=1 Tax=Pantoea brenneri TaxID=472694 RepID=UPI00244D4AA1|nr:Arc family DNA-binding protein [Pantoea brenneri]MDH1086328.1 Arc family DNA-binding protein [Pantoea brenneri]